MCLYDTSVKAEALVSGYASSASPMHTSLSAPDMRVSSLTVKCSLKAFLSSDGPGEEWSSTVKGSDREGEVKRTVITPLMTKVCLSGIVARVLTQLCAD